MDLNPDCTHKASLSFILFIKREVEIVLEDSFIKCLKGPFAVFIAGRFGAILTGCLLSQSRWIASSTTFLMPARL